MYVFRVLGRVILSFFLAEEGYYIFFRDNSQL